MKIVKGLLLSLILSLILTPGINALPTIHLDSAAVISSSFFTYVRAAMYFLPLGTVTAILAIQVSIWVFRIIVAVIKAVWDLLPFV